MLFFYSESVVVALAWIFLSYCGESPGSQGSSIPYSKPTQIRTNGRLPLIRPVTRSYLPLSGCHVVDPLPSFFHAPGLLGFSGLRLPFLHSRVSFPLYQHSQQSHALGEQCIAAHLFWVACRRLGKRSGWLFLALYLRQSRVCLQRFVARDSIPSDLSPAVSLTRSGLPRIIPSFHRRKIREGNHLVIQLYMSFFTVSRLIPLAKKIDKSLFDSIITPGPLESVKDVIYEMKSSFPGLLERYIPDLKSIPLNQGLEYSDFAFLTRYPGGFRTSIKRDTISPGPAFYHAYFIYLLSYLGLPDSSPPPRQA
ncbi:hypothetical protein HN51_043317 [Arachis hypogaea]